ATPPAAPIPTTTTSVARSLVAMAEISLRSIHGGRLLEHLGVVCRSADGFELAGLQLRLIGLADPEADAGIADQVPADEVRVAPVVGVSEGALPGVAFQHREEGSRAAGET